MTEPQRDKVLGNARLAEHGRTVPTERVKPDFLASGMQHTQDVPRHQRPPRRRGEHIPSFSSRISKVALPWRANRLPHEPMERLAVAKLPDGSQWLYEVKLDGYRAIAVKSGSKLMLFWRRQKSFNRQFESIAHALVDLREDTVVDGE